MHSVTDTIQQHTAAIKQRLAMTEANLQHHLERGAQRLIVRVTCILVASLALCALAIELTR